MRERDGGKVGGRERWNAGAREGRKLKEERGWDAESGKERERERGAHSRESFN